MRQLVPFLESLVLLDLGFYPSLLDHWRTLSPLYQWTGNNDKNNNNLNTNGSPNLGQTTRPYNNQQKKKKRKKKKENLQNCGFCCSG